MEHTEREYFDRGIYFWWLIEKKLNNDYHRQDFGRPVFNQKNRNWTFIDQTAELITVWLNLYGQFVWMIYHGKAAPVIRKARVSIN